MKKMATEIKTASKTGLSILLVALLITIAFTNGMMTIEADRVQLSPPDLWFIYNQGDLEEFQSLLKQNWKVRVIYERIILLDFVYSFFAGWLMFILISRRLRQINRKTMFFLYVAPMAVLCDYIENVSFILFFNFYYPFSIPPAITATIASVATPCKWVLTAIAVSTALLLWARKGVSLLKKKNGKHNNTGPNG
jgi:hypothetical protein